MFILLRMGGFVQIVAALKQTVCVGKTETPKSRKAMELCALAGKQKDEKAKA